MSNDGTIIEYYRILREEDRSPVGTVCVRGEYRVQKQRDGSWLRLGPARPGEAKLSSKRSAFKLPRSRKRSPLVKEIPILVGKTWQDQALDMPESTMDVMFKSKEEPEPTPFGPGPDVDQDEEGNEDGEKGDEEPEPKPERKALHERILRTFLFPVDETPLDRMPVAVLVLGGPCSSRSAVVKNLAREGRFVRVDPEAIGSLCPEYEEAIQKTARNAPSIVKEEAGFISRRLIEKATEDRKNLAIEAIGQDPPECYDLLNSLEDLGYYTIVILMDADRSTIIDRNKFRGSRCGRWVQREAFSLGKVAALTFEKLKAKKKAQEFIRLDVRGEAPKIVRSVLEELDELVEDESDEPDKPSISYKKIRTLAFEGIQREVANTKALPEKYKPSEGPLLDHYDDFHIRAVDVEEEEEEVEP